MIVDRVDVGAAAQEFGGGVGEGELRDEVERREAVAVALVDDGVRVQQQANDLEGAFARAAGRRGASARRQSTRTRVHRQVQAAVLLAVLRVHVRTLLRHQKVHHVRVQTLDRLRREDEEFILE